MKMKRLQRVCITLVVFIGFLTVAPPGSHSLTNQWTNAYNNYWHNDNNWSLGHIPLPGEDVLIPNISPGTGPGIAFHDEECLGLTINTGTDVEIYDKRLSVNSALIVHGALRLSDPLARVICKTDVSWHAGSRAFDSGPGRISVYGIWDFIVGANVQLDDGWVYFAGSSVGYIRSRANNSYFHHVRIDKINNYVGHSGQSSAPLIIKGNLIISILAELRSYTSEKIQVGGYLFNEGGTVNLRRGTIEFLAGEVAHYMLPGDHLNHVVINAGGRTSFDFGVEIGGLLSIIQGALIIEEDPIIVQ